MPTTTDPTLPSYQRPEVDAVAPDLALVADLLAGTRQMQRRAKEAGYIRKWADEEQAVYDIRRQCETVFEGMGRTLSAATGMLFAKPPALEWNASEAAIKPHWDNIDAAGTKGTVLVKRYSEASIRDGLGAILVDHPSAPVDPVTGQPVTITAANEVQYGLRPTWAIYARAQVINWRTTVVNNRRALSMVVLHECADVETGDFGIGTVNRYREVRLILTPTGYQATWRLWEQVGEKGASADDFKVVSSGVFRNRKGEIADFLPVSTAYTGRTNAPMTATIPLLGVAWANLAHWRLSTALTFSTEVAAYAQGVLVGDVAVDPQTGAPGKLRMGPLSLINVKGEGASFEWKAPPVEAFAPLETRIEEKVGQMGKLGMAFLAPSTRAAETAEAKRLDATAENSTLATAAQGIEDAVNAALEFHAWYVGIDKAGAPVLTINRDFESTTLDPQTMTAYVNAVANAGLPIRLLLEAWQAGGRIGPDEDLDALEAEMEAAKAAADEAAKQAAADALAAQDGAPTRAAA